MKISNCAEVVLSQNMFLLKVKNSNLKSLIIKNIGRLIVNNRSLAFQNSVSVSLLNVKKIWLRYKMLNIKRETLIQF